jgi:hypothetical protein
MATAAKAVTLQAANIRSGAGIFYDIVKTVSAGTEVDVLGKTLGWYKVTAGATTGYTYNTLVRIYDSAIAAEYDPVKANYEKLASYATLFSSTDPNRNYNMELGAYKNQVIVKPGASFSFNANTGDSTTTANGWRESIILVDSVRTKGIGGGLCQCSSTIYSAVKQVPKLTILERNPHSVPVGYVPRENEAMVNYGTSDFRFRNDNSFSIFVCTLIDFNAGRLTCTIYKVNPVQQPAPVPKIVIDGKAVSFSVAPRMINDNIYVEMRSIFEYLGYAVTYDAATKATRMAKGSVQFILEQGVDSKEIISVKDGTRTAIKLSYPIYLVSDRTMLAIRMIGELLGYDVSWDEKSYTDTLTMKSK